MQIFFLFLRLRREEDSKKGKMPKKAREKLLERNWISSNCSTKQIILGRIILKQKLIVRNRIVSECYVEKKMKRLMIW